MLTTLLASSLVGMLYVLDEPSVGLHSQDTERMAKAILGLRDRGNTVILIEHEPHLMGIADRVVEIGPQAGEPGGYITFDGTPNELLTSQSLTGEYLSGRRDTKRKSRQPGTDWLGLRGATGRNLQIDELRIPLRCLTVMVGPSGAGKSSLILDTLCPAIERIFDSDTSAGLPFVGLFGVEQISGCLVIDQSPIPRSNRSSPATYSKAMEQIRQVFAETVDAKTRRFTPSHFSFNSEVGRCPTCEGLGFATIDMQFMADVHLPCQDCDGKRYLPDVLEVRFRDLSISEVLEMCVDRAFSFFRGSPNVQERLRPLIEIGLGYLPLGQSLSTLSAGESMRLKLASHLDFRIGGHSRVAVHGKLVVMDEPTTGLHFQDVDRLLQCIDALLDQGHTVLVIEHNQQMIRAADHLIEMGPGAGQHGGKIIAPINADR
jgi:excinuclease ABC subunit A